MTTLRLLRVLCNTSQHFSLLTLLNINILTDFIDVTLACLSLESITTSSSSSSSIGIGSLVGGVLPALCDQATDRVLPAADEFRACKSVKRDSGVFGGSISEEESRGIFELYFALDVLETEVTDFCKGLDAGVFGGFEPAGAFAKKAFKLFCFKESVEAVSLDDIAAKRSSSY
jgi:hypothetical protein